MSKDISISIRKVINGFVLDINTETKVEVTGPAQFVTNFHHDTMVCTTMEAVLATVKSNLEEEA